MSPDWISVVGGIRCPGFGSENWRSSKLGTVKQLTGVEVRSSDQSKQIQELLLTLKSLVQATEVCLTGVRTDNKEAQELIELAKQLTYRARVLIDIALPER